MKTAVSYSVIILQILTWLLRSGLSVTSDPCPMTLLPLEYTQWKQPPTEQLIVTWKLPTCTNSIECLGVEAPFKFPSIFQQLPNHIQQETSIIFKSEAQNIVYWKVPSETALINCNFTEAVKINGNLVSMQNNYLSFGNNYFIANGSEFFQLCMFGYKLNVTVQDYDCLDRNNVCSGKGRCAALPWDTKYSCRCCAGQKGKYCEEVDGCYNVRCQNNGVCVDLPDAQSSPTNLFRCNCPTGFAGTMCEEQTASYCTANLCMNGGTCFVNASSPTSYTCACVPVFTGKVCETPVEFCRSAPCLHGALCLPAAALPYYQCQCVQGFQGANCELDRRKCTEATCKNGGECLVLNDSPVCKCSLGFAGKDCSLQSSGCDSNPCLHALECIITSSGYRCTCLPGYQGDNCDTNTDECVSNPCPVGSRCVDLVASYSCESSSTTQISTVHPLNTPPGKTIAALVDASIAAASATTAASTASALSSVAIAFIVIGLLLLVALVAALVWWCVCRGKWRSCCGRKRPIQYVRHIDMASDKTNLPTVYPGEIFGDDSYPEFSHNPRRDIPPLLRKKY